MQSVSHRQMHDPKARNFLPEVRALCFLGLETSAMSWRLPKISAGAQLCALLARSSWRREMCPFSRSHLQSQRARNIVRITALAASPPRQRSVDLSWTESILKSPLTNADSTLAEPSANVITIALHRRPATNF